MLIKTENVDVVGITETWGNVKIFDKIFDSEIEISVPYLTYFERTEQQSMTKKGAE